MGDDHLGREPYAVARKSGQSLLPACWGFPSEMSESISSPAPRATFLRPLVIAAIAVLAVGIGAVAGAFLLTARASGAGPAAGYVPADAPMYLEWRVVPSDEQDAALRGILARFPIPDFDADQPLVDQLTDKLDEELAGSGFDFSYESDVAPWWDGRLAIALTEVPSMTEAVPAEMPGALFLVGVTDADAASAAIERLRDTAAPGAEFESTEHAGTMVWTVTDPFGGSAGSYAVTDDQIVFAATTDDVTAALDRHAAGDDSIADGDAMRQLGADLPEDWLMLGIVNGEALLAEMQRSMEEQAPEMASMYAAMLGEGSFNGVMTLAATEDRILFDAVGNAPTGDIAVTNEDRGLAAQVPADALLYAEGGSVGASLSQMITAFEEMAGAGGEGLSEDLGPAEALLGGDLTDLVSWIDDGALVAGWDGSQPYAGLILVPSDPEAARETIDGLLALANFGTLDPSLGVTIEEETIGDAEVTTIRWEGQIPLGELGIPAPDGEPVGVALQVSQEDDRVILGIGDGFATRVLQLAEADSLASMERFAAAVEDVGGTTNAGMTWIDVTGTRQAVESAFGDAGLLDQLADYETEVKPWLAPFDSFVAVMRVDGDRVVQRSALIFE